MTNPIFPTNLPVISWRASIPESTFFIIGVIVAVMVFVKEYLDLTMHSLHNYTKALVAAFVVAAGVFVFVCVDISAQLEGSAYTDPLLQLVRSSLLFGAMFMLIGPLLLLSPVRKIYVTSRIARAIVGTAHKKETRYTAFVLFTLVCLAQVAVIYSLGLVLYRVFGLELVDVLGTCVCYFLLVIFYLIAFYSSMLKKTVSLRGIKPIELVRDRLTILDTQGYLVGYIVFYAIAMLASLGVTIAWFIQDMGNRNRAGASTDSLIVSCVFFGLTIVAIFAFAVFLLVEAFRVKKRIEKKPEPRPEAERTRATSATAQPPEGGERDAMGTEMQTFGKRHVSQRRDSVAARNVFAENGGDEDDAAIALRERNSVAIEMNIIDRNSRHSSSSSLSSVNRRIDGEELTIPSPEFSGSVEPSFSLMKQQLNEPQQPSLGLFYSDEENMSDDNDDDDEDDDEDENEVLVEEAPEIDADGDVAEEQRGPSSVSDAKMSRRSDLTRISKEVAEVEDVMRQNISNVLDRNDRIDDLVDKADSLALNARAFAKNAKKLRGKPSFVPKFPRRKKQSAPVQAAPANAKQEQKQRKKKEKKGKKSNWSNEREDDGFTPNHMTSVDVPNVPVNLSQARPGSQAPQKSDAPMSPAQISLSPPPPPPPPAQQAAPLSPPPPPGFGRSLSPPLSSKKRPVTREGDLGEEREQAKTEADTSKQASQILGGIVGGRALARSGSRLLEAVSDAESLPIAEAIQLAIGKQPSLRDFAWEDALHRATTHVDALRKEGELAPLSADEAIAIHLFSQDDSAFSKAFMKLIDDENFVELAEFLPFLKILFAALQRLPLLPPGTVLSFVSTNPAHEEAFQIDEDVVWWPPTCCTRQETKHLDHGVHGPSVMFHIHAHAAADIRRYTGSSRRMDSVLLPGAQYHVDNIDSVSNLVDITLTQVSK